MNKRDYYEVLGINKSATESEIKTAFRNLSKKYHPDRQTGKSDSEKKAAEEKFKEAAEAYETLSDKTKRSNYDQFGFNSPNMSSNFGGFDMSDFMSRHSNMFSSFFGDDSGSPFGFNFGGFGSHRQQKTFNPKAPENGKDIQTNIEISFKESVFGNDNKEFSLSLQKPCSKCNGTGIKHGTTPKECKTCNGTGTLVQQQRTPFGVSITQTVCPYCKGKGTQFEQCETCNGTKRVADKKIISVKIPAGINNGQRLRLSGQGQCGVNGGRDGDLYLNIHVKPSDIFTRNGNDVQITAYVSAITATIGGKITIPTLTGYKDIKINPGTYTDTIQRISKAGINGGDLLIKIVVEPISALTAEQQKLLEKLNSTLTSKNNRRDEELKQKAETFYKN